MRILFIGDVFGSLGKRILAEHLKTVLREYAVDLCIANGENIAGGKGLTLPLVKKLRKFGVQVITGGNHSFADPQFFKNDPPVEHVLRPLNMKNESRGTGTLIFPLPDGRQAGIINLQGRTFFQEAENLDCPFKTGLAAIEELSAQTRIILVDFHAEATSEKVCLANYFDGKVSAVLGTHTHVQTADERILPKGTAYITDVGLTGSEDSAIGMRLEQVIGKFLNDEHARFQPADSGPIFCAVVVDADETTGKAKSIERIYRRVSFRNQLPAGSGEA